MAAATCPDCGSSELYRSALNTPANGMFGPTLLPGSSAGRFRVVVCKNCGLTRFYASTFDMAALPGDGWEPVSNASGPLGLSDA